MFAKRAHSHQLLVVSYFVVLTKTRIGLEHVARNWQSWCITVLSLLSIKTLCLSVLNDDNTVVHPICKCKYFHPWYILWAYSIFHQNNENNNNNDQTLNGSFSKKSTVFFTVLYYTGLPSRVFSLSHQNTTKQFINHFHSLTCGLSSIAVLELRGWGK